MSIIFSAQQIDANIEANKVAGKVKSNNAAMMLEAYGRYCAGDLEEGKGIVNYINKSILEGTKTQANQELHRASTKFHKANECKFAWNEAAQKYHAAKVVDNAIILAPVRVTEKQTAKLVALAQSIVDSKIDDELLGKLEAALSSALDAVK